MLTRALSVTLVVLLLLLPVALADDELSLTYRKAYTRYGNGEGVLSSSQSGAFSLRPGDATPFAHSGASVQQVEGGKVYLKGESFTYSFLTPRPSGHGYYTISLNLPETEPEKKITLRLEEGKKVIRSNIDFQTHSEGDYLVLEATTDRSHLQLSFITELMYMLLMPLLATLIFSLLLLGFSYLRRATISANFKKIKALARRRSEPHLEVEEQDSGYRIHYTSPARTIKRLFMGIKNILAGREGRSSLYIPYWLITAVILVILLFAFFNSITNPIQEVWSDLGSYQIVFILAAVALSVFSLLFILSAGDERAFIMRLAVVGAGVVGITFAYMGIIALLLALTTAALIYFLSVLLLEEEYETENIRENN